MAARIKVLKQIISKWGISKSELARRMPMSIGVFSNKMSDTQKNYRFTDVETDRICVILDDMASDIKTKLAAV